MQETSAEDKAALLDGIWTFARKGTRFDRKWFKRQTAAEIPLLAKIIRVWDLAGTKPNEDNPDPDWTRGLLIGKSTEGFYYLLDMVGIRGTPGEIERFVAKTAERDGQRIKIFIQQDPGQAGKSQIYHYKKDVLPGYRVEGWPTGNKSKVERADPVSGAAENEFIFIKAAGWNEDFFNEVEVFPQDGYHDDMVDVLSDGYNILTRRKGTTYERGAERWLIPA
jgi:predicted phage terminase large subunit-like protein